MKFPTLKLSNTKFNERMDLHTSFEIGGPCDIFVTPKTYLEIKYVIDFVNQNKLSLLIIGNGTNLLVPDKGLHGVVVKIGSPCFCEFHLSNESITVEVGISFSMFAEIVANQGLSGLEFAVGIPGTLGGAIVMNAGAQGKRIGDIVERVKVMDREGSVYWLKNSEINFGYRESRFKNSNEIILEAKLHLKKGNQTKIKEQIQEILKERELRLPLEFPSAGCVFKNPQNIPARHFPARPAPTSEAGRRQTAGWAFAGGSAGKLIELSGLKGLKVGDAQISTKHANFIVNLGKATYKDVVTLISEVQHQVYKKFKISLEPELIIL
ncbi:UDP-N-acetylmuramate dehydrogenase [candidate division WOR-3 bacterium]|nr:UDP-N-acetylmuramate dehydrogenase [candidate division WOR-3 bacterium]